MKQGTRLLYFYKIVINMIVLSFLSLYPATAQQNYDEFVRQQQNEYKDFDKEYEEFEKQQAEAFARYIAEVKRKWNEFKNSTNKEWFEYSHDLNTLSKVDFEQGMITITTLVEKDKDDIMVQAQGNIREKIRGLFLVDSLTGDVILENQVEFSSPPVIDSNNVVSFADEKVAPGAKIEKDIVKSEDGIERLKITASFSMVPDHLEIRARKYLPLVRKYCDKYNLNIPLVLAIMQTESFFNPRAKSHIPAFGLMQLVPKYGAREAYRFVYSEDKIVRPYYLYNPENNIHLGCAYLAKMRDNEFKEVNDNVKLRYCLVASYNTGPGNLSKALIGKKKLGPAINKINEMDTEQLFVKLKKDLPYEETRDYLVKVETRRENYFDW